MRTRVGREATCCLSQARQQPRRANVTSDDGIPVRPTRHALHSELLFGAISVRGSAGEVRPWRRTQAKGITGETALPDAMTATRGQPVHGAGRRAPHRDRVWFAKRPFGNPPLRAPGLVHSLAALLDPLMNFSPPRDSVQAEVRDGCQNDWVTARILVVAAAAVAVLAGEGALIDAVQGLSAAPTIGPMPQTGRTFNWSQAYAPGNLGSRWRRGDAEGK